MQRSIAVEVSGLASDVTALAASELHTCALTVGRGVLCWGSNEDGQLGDGTTTDRWTPVPVSGLASGVTALAAGHYSHTCALTTGSGMLCWGDNNWGQLGDGTTEQRLTPVLVSGLTSDVTTLAAGGSHTCAVTAGSGVMCWGGNLVNWGWHDRGSASPVPVSGLESGVTALAAGFHHTCAVATGGVLCWG
jgi:alpha-tubulin suppressor-like RCC1 family protein